MSQHTTYHFYPTVRRGYRPTKAFSLNEESSSDAENSAGVNGGGRLAVNFEALAKSKEDGESKKKGEVDLRMYGPEHVAGIDPGQVAREYPEPATTGTPPNYFAAVEFEAPDLPWRFSPVRDDKQGRVMPWCGLVVVKRDDQARVQLSGDRPLPTIEAPRTKLPPVREMWAWAHAQMVGGTSGTAEEEFKDQSMATRSRLISPRNLQPNTAYVAAVVPLFAAGKKAGKGKDPGLEENQGSNSDNSSSSVKYNYAWSKNGKRSGEEDGNDSRVRVELPVYHSWEFSTGKRGDFEYLVDLLEPRNLSSDDYEVGRREVDVSDPGPENLRPDDATNGDATNGTVRMGGALRKPNAERLAPYSKREALRTLLNEGGGSKTFEGDDQEFEIIGPPTYGEWHAQEMTLEPPERPPEERKQWLYDLNLHPAYRVAAGLGSEVVRERQEQFMSNAWDQVGQIREINRLLARAQLSETVMRRQAEEIKNHPTSWSLQFTAPAHDRLSTEGGPAGERLRESQLPTAVLAAAFRRLTGPNSRLARRLDSLPRTDVIIEGLNSGDLSIVPETETPDGMQTVDSEGSLGDRQLLEKLCNVATDRLPESSRDSIARIEEIRKCVEEMAGHLRNMINSKSSTSKKKYDIAREKANDKAKNLGYEYLKDAVDNLSSPEELEVKDTAEALLDVLDALRQREGSIDSDPVAIYLKDLFCDAKPKDERTDGALPAKVSKIVESFTPAEALVERINVRITSDKDKERFTLSNRPVPLDRVMAYPKFPQPTADDLREISENHLLPGVSEIPKNTVGALETNPPFIEAFMVGLNHSFASELLWRDYPTDRRLSSFRQFWDPSARIPKPENPEDLKDVAEVHTWDDKTDGDDDILESPLGSNTTTGGGRADEGGDSARETNSNVVLVVRGDLLQRYPSAVIYAVKAKRDDSGDKEPHWPSESVDSGGVDTPFLRFPIFRGKIGSDVTFLGFDLTAKKATGTIGTPSVEGNGQDNLGWFFVFEESPGEPRFGIDTETDTEVPPAGMTYDTTNGASTQKVESSDRDVEVGWQGLKWGHIRTGDADPSDMPNLHIKDSRPGEENWRVGAGDDWSTDDPEETIPPKMAAEWGYNSAHMARILWQKPVRVAIHADDLLPEEGD